MPILLAVVLLLLAQSASATEPLGEVVVTLPAVQNFKWIEGTSRECRAGVAVCKRAEEKYKKILAGARGRTDVVVAVHKAANAAFKHQYEPAGQDRWQSPLTSLALGAGDCEDYALLKYKLLRDLGVPDARMRLVAFVGHAVLAVERLGGGWVILDNRLKGLASGVRGFGPPVFSVNDGGYRIYALKRASP